MPESDDAGTVLNNQLFRKAGSCVVYFHFVRTVYDPFGHTTYETLGL